MGIKENGESYTIDLSVAMKAHPYICGMRNCNLCLYDLCLCEILIARANSAILLDKRDKLVSNCCHMSKLRTGRFLFT